MKSANIQSKLIAFLIMMLVSITSSFATTYYRGDARAPDVVKEAGGLFPKRSEEVPPPRMDMSLFNHVFGASYPATGYVSTSLDLSYVLNFFAPIGTYVYYIQGSENLIDVNAALGEYAGTFAREEEFAAIGGIPWRQIVGWRLREDTPQILGPLIRNPDYAGDAAFSGDGNSNIAEIAALTGFGPDHPAWRQYPWNQYPLPGCGNSQLRDAKTSDQCLTSERIAEWTYLSKYKASQGSDKKVIFRQGIDSPRINFPTTVKTWTDIDGKSDLSLCGLFYDSEGSKTKITCARNKGNFVFEAITSDQSDYGWTGTRAFMIQNDGKAAYCRQVWLTTYFTCAKTTSAYFNQNVTSPGYIDSGYSDSRAWPSVFTRGGTSAGFCRITGNGVIGFYMNCDRFLNNSWESSVFTSRDFGWPDSRVWLDIKGQGPGRDAFCRFIGTITIQLRCNLRTGDNSWSPDITSGKVDGGTRGSRFAVRMKNSKAQEYCRVTGGLGDYLTCTYMETNNVLVNYSTLLPRYINSTNVGSVNFSDVDGDGRDDLCFLDRSNKSVYCHLNKGRSFNKNAVTISLRNSPLENFAPGTTKIMPITYTDQGPVATICYNSSAGWMTCDQSWVR